jgi:uncharacterized alpha-E superfamily protein
MSDVALLSRAAESVFWACRYVERAECTARIIDVNLNLLLDSPIRAKDQWSPLFQVTGDEEAFYKRFDRATQANVMRFLTFDPSYGNSIVSCLYRARENARSVREIISSEMWEQFNKFYLLVQEAGESGRAHRHPSEFYREVRMASHLLEGLTSSTMSHNEAWHFGRIGRMLERADQSSRILDVKYFILLPQVDYVGTSMDDIQWGAVLKSCSGFEMYRKRFGRIAPDKIVEFLLLNLDFPRSVLHSVNEASASLHAITGVPIGNYSVSSERLLGQISSELVFAEIDDVILSGLHEYLDRLQMKLNDVGSAIHSNFFQLDDPITHAMVQTQS